MPNIRCNYGNPKYAIGDRVLHNGKTYIVIGFVLPYDERSLEFCYEDAMGLDE